MIPALVFATIFLAFGSILLSQAQEALDCNRPYCLWLGGTMLLVSGVLIGVIGAGL